MKTKKIIIVASLVSIFLLALIAIIAPSKKPVFDKEDVYPGVYIKIQIDKVETKELMGELYAFVYFRYTIQNQNLRELFFNPGNIKVNYNGLINQSVEYDSLASAMTEAEKLPIGTKEYALYFVFNQPEMSESISQFEILNTGLGSEREVDNAKD